LTVRRAQPVLAAAVAALLVATAPRAESAQAGCGRGGPEACVQAAPEEGVRVVEGTGRVIAISSRFVTIAHDDIPGLMPPMTMEFELASPALARRIAPGQAVRFTLRVRGADMTVTALRRRSGAPRADAPAGPRPTDPTGRPGT
jgi:Cu/Ag efflux protein CusF